MSGEGKATEKSFASIGNKHSQIVSFVLMCEGFTECLEPMDRFQQASQSVLKIFYLDCGCCRAAVETLFQGWVDNGMVVHLDIFHWIHRFDAAIRTDSMLCSSLSYQERC